MPIDQALKEFNKYADDFALIGDAEEAIKNNKEEFLHKWTKVNQYYLYIFRNTEPLSDEYFDCIDILSDIAADNPGLEEWVKMIIDRSYDKVNELSQQVKEFDTSSISGPIESLLTEIKNMTHWDSEEIEDIKFLLIYYKNELIANQGSFEQNHYQSLLRDVNATLSKIDRFYEMINSEDFDEFRGR